MPNIGTLNPNTRLSQSEIINHCERLVANLQSEMQPIKDMVSGNGKVVNYGKRFGIDVSINLSEIMQRLTESEKLIGEFEETYLFFGDSKGNAIQDKELSWDNINKILSTTQLKLSAGATINEFSSDVLLAGNSDTAVPTEKAVKAYSDVIEASAVLIDGSRELTANWDAGSFKITAETFESDVVTGTAPFIVASTTVIPNLNAHMVDGYHHDQSLLQAASPSFVELSLTDDINCTTNNKGLVVGATNKGSIVHDGTNMLYDSQVVGTGNHLFPTGNIGVGISAPTSKVQVWGSGGSFKASRFTTHPNGGASCTLQRSANATIGSHLLVPAGYKVGAFNWHASDGVNWQEAAKIQVYTEAGTGIGSMPSRISFETTAAGGITPIVTFVVDSSQNCKIVLDNKYMKFGIGGDAGCMYNATNWVFNPKLVGSGVMLADTNSKWCFRDTAIGIYSQADGYCDMFADTGWRIGDSSAGSPTNYIQLNSTGDLTFHGSAGFYPRALNQSAEPAAGTGATQLDTSEACVWTDTDDSKCYFCYNHGGTIKKIELT